MRDFLVISAAVFLGLCLGVSGASLWWQARWIRYLEHQQSVYIPRAGAEGGVTAPPATPEQQAAEAGMEEAIDGLAAHLLDLAKAENRQLSRDGALDMAREMLTKDLGGGGLT